MLWELQATLEPGRLRVRVPQAGFEVDGPDAIGIMRENGKIFDIGNTPETFDQVNPGWRQYEADVLFITPFRVEHFDAGRVATVLHFYAAKALNMHYPGTLGMLRIIIAAWFWMNHYHYDLVFPDYEQLGAQEKEAFKEEMRNSRNSYIRLRQVRINGKVERL